MCLGGVFSHLHLGEGMCEYVCVIRVRKRDCVHAYTLGARDCVCADVPKPACSWGEHGECVVR